MPTHLPMRPKPEYVLSACYTVMSVDPSEFRGRGKSERCVTARRLCVWLMRKHIGLSYPEIARVMGRTNHSTTINMKIDADAMAERDPKRWAELVDRAEAEIVRMIPSEVAERERVRLLTADLALDELRRINWETETRFQQRITRERDRLGIKEPA